MFLDDGFDARGVDLPALSVFWEKRGNPPSRFFACDATALPFADGFFDVVYSLGVFEHIGTTTGHYSLAPDYRDTRRRYASELLRVTRKGGRILVAAPNKGFPVDIQHGAVDSDSPNTALNRLRVKIHAKTKMTLHQTWGRYYLPTYAETAEYFVRAGGASEMVSPPLKNYFGFGRFNSGVLSGVRRLAEAYANNLPPFLRRTCFNPYMIALIRK